MSQEPVQDRGAEPPSSGRQDAPWRGVGMVAGVASFGVMGVVDGLLALRGAAFGGLAAHLAALVVLHCVAVVLAFGVVLGLFEELCLWTLARLPFMRRFAVWALGGPPAWFAPDPDVAAALLAVGLGLTTAFGPTFPFGFVVIRTFHSKPLAALAITLMQIASTVLGGAVALVLTPALRALTRRMGRLGSPGFVVGLAALLVTAQSVRFFRINWETFKNLEFRVAALAGALVLGNALALLVAGARVRRRGSLSRVAVAGSVALASLAIVVSALTLGARQSVAATVFSRSVLTQRVARSLQLALDLDRDGFSAVFNGGDCNDRDRRINPRARDIPGNGIDENCSGRDARVEVERSDGGIVPLPSTFGNRPPSVVLLSLDAMRPDHMSAYGYRRPTTPNLDAFTRGAARFTNAYCASPRSLRSFASLMVGRYPSMVQWGNDVQFPPLEEANLTLAEKLHEGGYFSAAMHDTSYFGHTAGFFQGFDQVFEQYGFDADDPAPTIQQITAFLRTRQQDGRPFLLWTHMMEPHDPYRDRTSPQEFGHTPMDRYDEEIASADASLAPVLAQLDEISKERPLFVFVYADHGEAFGEHGVNHHSFDLHDEALRVPLLVRGPGVVPGTRDALVSLMDIHPTVLNLARRPVASPVSGLSLVPLLARGDAQGLTPPGWRTHLFGEVTPDGLFPSEQRSLYAPPYKLIHDVRRGTWELYDIARDPGERRNLYDDRRALAADLRERLLTWSEHSTLASNRTSEVIAAARLPREPVMQHPVHVRFGDILELLGYDLPRDSVRINESYRVVLYYRVLRRTRVPVSLGVSFQPVDGQPIWPLFRARHYPLNGRYPSTEWNAGEILRDEVAIRVDPEMRAVSLRSYFALEIAADGTRIPPAAGNDGAGQLEIAPVTIVP
jgi:arylsulfatase A-like enzyme